MFARLFILFVTVPLIELFLFLVIGQRIGILPTFAIILLTGVLGAGLARSQGIRVFARYQAAIVQGRIPHDAVIEGLLILVAGTLLLTPGFLTDTIGFLLLAPAVRRIVRERVEDSLRKRFRFAGTTGTGNSDTRSRHADGPAGVITVEAEVVESTVHQDRGDRP